MQHCGELRVFVLFPQGQVPGPTDFTTWTQTQVKVSQVQTLVSGSVCLESSSCEQNDFSFVCRVSWSKEGKTLMTALALAIWYELSSTSTVSGSCSSCEGCARWSVSCLPDFASTGVRVHNRTSTEARRATSGATSSFMHAGPIAHFPLSHTDILRMTQEAEADEDDPLDLYMKGIDQEVKDDKSSGRKAKPGIELDEEDAVADFLEV